MPAKLNAPTAEEAAQKVRFGNFEIMNDPEGRPLALGKGTFGRTYQARHCYLDTIVALKIITERYATDPGVRQRFLTEARAVAKLSHPHIARLYDFGEMDGVLHYAMEYCGGGSLADLVGKGGPVALRQVLEVGQQIAGALKCAHAGGFIHRDLKPSNIMLTAPDGPPFTKLIDFGLVQPSLPGATRSIADDQSADGERFLGTPLFASPEQLREEPMDVRTDLFSLGMTLWYLLLGGAPESGPSAAIAASRLSGESYAARLPATLPPQVRDVLARLLEKDRNKRFSSAAETFAAFNLCATPLGFRRARDYTDPKEQLAEWEDDGLSDQGSSQAAEPEPIEVEIVDAELSSKFSIIARINEDFTGLNYVAASTDERERDVILHVLHPLLLEDVAAFERLRVHIAQLIAVDVPEILRPQAIKSYSDYVSVVLEKPAGSDLLSILRTGRAVGLIEAAPLLESIGDACDALCAAGLPGVQLAPGRIFIEWPDGEDPQNQRGGSQLSRARPKLHPRFLAVSEAPELARLNEPEDASSTMTTDMLSDPSRADNMAEHFGTLLYRVVAGRNCPIAASLSSQAYVAIPGLSEHSNRLLSLVIANQIASTTCGQVLREVLGAEGIVPRVPGHPTAGFTARGIGSTVSPVAATPPVGGKTPTQFATPPLILTTDKHATPARTWRAPATVAKGPPPVAVPKPPSHVAGDEPLKTSSLPPAETLARDSRPSTSEKGNLEKPPAKPEVDSIPAAPIKSKSPAAEKDPIMPPGATSVVAQQSPVIPVESKAASPSQVSPLPVLEIPKVRVEQPEEKPLKTPAPPAQAREKDLAVAPIVPKSVPKKSMSKAVEESKKTVADTASVVTKARDEAPATREKTPSAPPAEKRDLPPPKILKPLAVPAAQAKTSEVSKAAASLLPSSPFKEGLPWESRTKFRYVGIGIAALLVVSLSYAVIRKFSTPAPRPAPVVAAAQPSHPSPVAEKPVRSIPAAPANKPAEPPQPMIAGHYVGRFHLQQSATEGPEEFDREISIDPGLTTGYLIDYGTNGGKQMPLTEGRIDVQGNYSARVLFASTTGGTHGDENLTLHPKAENGHEVTFQGRASSGNEYTLLGTLRPWTDSDGARYRDLLAEQAEQAEQAAQTEQAAQKKKTAEQAKIAAQPQIVPKLNPEEAASTGRQTKAKSGQTNKRGATGTENASKTTRGEHASGRSTTTAAPPPAKPPGRAAPPRKTESERPKPAFEGGPPGT